MWDLYAVCLLLCIAAYPSAQPPPRSLRIQTKDMQVLPVLPVNEAGTVLMGYNCPEGDVAAKVIHDAGDSQESEDRAVGTCRAECQKYAGCHVWTLDRSGSHPMCHLKHSCHGGRPESLHVSGFIDKSDKLEHVMAPKEVTSHDLEGVMEDTNCWGQDISEVVVLVVGKNNLDDTYFEAGCHRACESNPKCKAWTLNRGSEGKQGHGHCWLKSACVGISFDTHARAGLINREDHESEPGTTENQADNANSTSFRATTPSLGISTTTVLQVGQDVLAGAATGGVIGGLALGLLAGVLGAQNANDTQNPQEHESNTSAGAKTLRLMGSLPHELPEPTTSWISPNIMLLAVLLLAVAATSVVVRRACTRRSRPFYDVFVGESKSALTQEEITE